MYQNSYYTNGIILKKKIAKILNKQYQNLQEIGWKLTQEEIEKDINYLFRDAYLNFINKKL